MVQRIIACLFLSVTFADAQSWQDLSESRPVNFDKLLVGTDKMIYVQPPPGKYWVIVQGSFYMERSVPGASVMIWTESAPYGPYRDPLTGKMNEGACHTCVMLVQARAEASTLFPIVGGTSLTGRTVLQGQTMPIVITYPNRLMITATPEHGGLAEPLQTWARFTIVERSIVTSAEHLQ